MDVERYAGTGKSRGCDEQAYRDADVMKRQNESYAIILFSPVPDFTLHSAAIQFDRPWQPGAPEDP